MSACRCECFWQLYLGMQYKKFKPDKSLFDFVLCYFIWEGQAEKAIDIESPPSALCSLVFNLAEPYFISNSKYDKQKVPKTFVTGQAIKNYTLHLHGEIKIIGAVLKPVGLFHFFNIPMYNLTGERVDFSVIDPDQSESLFKKIKMVSTDVDRIKFIEDYLLKLLQSANNATGDIISAANEIYEQRGQNNVSEIMEEVLMSRRSFERRFLNEVGVSPKVYAKIRRFGYTCKLMAGKRDVNLMDVLCEGGYYDQSHFIKDFKYFSGRTPRIYVKTNTELDNYLDHISVVEARLQFGK